MGKRLYPGLYIRAPATCSHEQYMSLQGRLAYLIASVSRHWEATKTPLVQLVFIFINYVPYDHLSKIRRRAETLLYSYRENEGDSMRNRFQLFLEVYDQQILIASFA